MLSRVDIVDAVVEILGKNDEVEVSKAEASRWVQAVTNAYIKVIEESVDEETHLYIRGLGTFKKTFRKGGLKRNPLTGGNVEVPDKVVLKFRPAKGIRSVVAE